MKRRRCLRYGLVVFLCLWPLYTLYSTVQYRLSMTPQSSKDPLDEEVQSFLQQNVTQQSWLDPEVEIDEATFMKGIYIGAYKERQREVAKVLDKTTQQRIALPYKSQQDHVLLMHLFRPLLSCPTQKRLGTESDGHWVCGVESFLHQKSDCVIYSFNRNRTELSFEQELLEQTGCEVHVFDPFLSEPDKAAMHGVHPRMEFHDYTVALRNDEHYLLDDLTSDVQSVKEMSLSEIFLELGHRWIDVLKLNYDEETFFKLFEVAYQWKMTNKAKGGVARVPVGQLLFQLNTMGEASQIARGLVVCMNLGFAGFATEAKLGTLAPWENVAFSLINMRDARTFNASH